MARSERSIMEKRHKRRVGDVVEIDLGDGFHAYARILNEASFAVYDCRCDTELPLAEILKRPVLFRLAVMDWAVKKGRWKVIGGSPLEGCFSILPPKFIQDPIDKDRFSIYEHGLIRPASREECAGIERTAVWDPSHVEDRIRDHFAGRSNKWVESLSIRL
jgi:Immunity protein 26